MKVLLLLMSFFCFDVFASTTATLILRGSVPRLLEISIAPETLATTLDLTVNNSNVLVGLSTEKSNAAAGYSVNVSSANQGKLVNENNSNESVDYTMTYGGDAVNLLSGSDFSETTKGVKNKDIRISYTGQDQENLIEGNYSDILTFTISAN